MGLAVGIKVLDFLVVGASKCGTTSLHHYLRGHHQIFLPSGKDVRYFSSDEWWSKGWEWTVKEHYSSASPDACWGSVTPSCMEDTRVPSRIASTMPGLRRVALLRNPIDRALSQYRQQVRRGKENRSFTAAVEDQLESSSLERARAGRVGAEHRYLADGEYGRLLARFDLCLEPSLQHVAFTEDLGANPREVLEGIYSFIGVSGGSEPSNLGVRYHQGGSRERFPGLAPRLREQWVWRTLWRTLPSPWRRRFWTWYFTTGNVVREAPPPIDPGQRRSLAEFFAPDVARLAERFRTAPPWADFEEWTR